MTSLFLPQNFLAHLHLRNQGINVFHSFLGSAPATTKTPLSSILGLLICILHIRHKKFSNIFKYYTLRYEPLSFSKTSHSHQKKLRQGNHSSPCRSNRTPPGGHHNHRKVQSSLSHPPRNLPFWSRPNLGPSLF